MLGCNIRPFPAGWETVSKAAGAASTQLDAEQPPAYLLETPDQKASVPVRRQSQRQTAENQPQRLSKADKQRFCLRNLELCKIAKELEPDWHFLELTLAEQEIVRFLLAERQQVNNAATAPPISDCRSDKSSKSGSDVTERTGASEREARQWQRRYQHYFPYLEFSTETMTRLGKCRNRKDCILNLSSVE